MLEVVVRLYRAVELLADLLLTSYILKELDARCCRSLSNLSRQWFPPKIGMTMSILTMVEVASIVIRFSAWLYALFVRLLRFSLRLV